MNAESVARNLAAVKDRIAAAGGDVERVRIVAVTKGFGVEAVEAAAAAGLADVGENYGQELLAKWNAWRSRPDRAMLRWHLIGPIQRNKVRALAPAVSLWQAVDRAVAGVAVARHAPGAAALVEVNVAGDPAKAGCSPAEAPALVEHLREVGLDVRGLMTVAPAAPPAEVRPLFATLAALARRLELSELSMGMTADLDVAVEEGATIVRVGTALFGPRPSARGLRR